VQVIANINTVGVTRPEETAPGILIKSCLVELKNFECPVSILNTTESEIEITVSHVILDEIDTTDYEDAQVMAMRDSPKTEIPQSREERIRDLLRTEHLNAEEKRALSSICEEFSDIFYLEGDRLSHTTKIEHEINTKINSPSQRTTLPITRKT